MLAPAVAQIPNGGFENWVTPTGTSYQDPVGWITFNGLATLGGGTPTTEQGTPGFAGSYYAKMTTRLEPMVGIIAGMVITADAASGAGGFPYASRPSALTGQWKYGIEPQDTGMVAVYFSKWNASTLQRDSVGAGVALLQGSIGGWQAMSIPVTYFTSANPDTCIIAVFSSMNAPVAGSYVQVDALGFNGSSGIADQVANTDLRVYPSPATDMLNLVSDRQVAAVDVMDMTGRAVIMQGAFSGSAILNVKDLNPGRYVVQLRMVDGTRSVRSFVKE